MEGRLFTASWGRSSNGQHSAETTSDHRCRESDTAHWAVVRIYCRPGIWSIELRGPHGCADDRSLRRDSGVSCVDGQGACQRAVSYTHLRAHETRHDLVCRLLLEKKKNEKKKNKINIIQITKKQKKKKKNKKR